MFTGLILGLGRISGVKKFSGDLLFHITPLFEWDNPSQGESVACNGVCLTLENWNKATKEVQLFASAETLRCTNLSTLRLGDSINMERAMKLSDRFGGHIVSGHVDTVAQVDSIEAIGLSRRIRISYDPQWNNQVVEKGSIALDGISLTVNKTGNGWLEVNIIPETWKVTTVANWQKHSEINMETDVIGKYVSNLLRAYNTQSKNSSISEEFLAKNGFF